MPLLTRQFLSDIGLELDDENYQALSEHFDDTLYQRVIDEIVQELDPERAEELASLDATNDALVQQWLVTNVPDLTDIVSDEIDILLGELAEHTDQIDSDQR